MNLWTSKEQITEANEANKAKLYMPLDFTPRYRILMNYEKHIDQE